MANVMNELDATVKVCPKCGLEDDKGNVVCPADGTALKSKDKLIGTTIADKYEIHSLLGRGGMSIVYKGKHKMMDRDVAIKLLRPELVAIPQLVERFKRESKAISTLRHTGIVAVFDFGLMKNGTPFLVMDYLEGKTLDKVLKEQGRMDISKAVHLVAAACDALAHSHHKGIVHRDIKPSNLLVRVEANGKETLTIFDFGIAKMLSQDGSTIHKLTTSGEIFGSPLYMSPEQSEGDGIDARSDIYSMACVLHEMILGEPPFRGETPVETIMMHMNDEVRPFSEVNPNIPIPADVERAIRKALEKSSADRFQTIEEFHDAIIESATRSQAQVAAVTSLTASSSMELPAAMQRSASSVDNEFNNPQVDSYSGYEKPSSKFSMILKVVAAAMFVVVCTAGIFVALKHLANDPTFDYHIPTATNNGAEETNKPENTEIVQEKPDKVEKPQNGVQITEIKEEPNINADSLMDEIKVQKLNNTENMRLLGAPKTLHWSIELPDSLITEKPPALLDQSLATSRMEEKRASKCQIVVLEILPSELTSKQAAQAVWNKYFLGKAQSWVELNATLSKSYKELVIQEIQYPKEEGSEASAKLLMVYFRDGGRLVTAEFIPQSATYDEVLNVIDSFLPVLESAID